MLTQYRKIAGGEYVGFNNAVFLSERATADRNYALSYYMKENKCFPEATKNLSEALDFYFQLCSMEVTCETAAVMAATLANGGVCPITEERCIGSRPCRDVLSLMNSCGMYDYSGQFAFHVGLPGTYSSVNELLQKHFFQRNQEFLVCSLLLSQILLASLYGHQIWIEWETAAEV